MLTDREVVHSKSFDKAGNNMGCDDDDLAELQKAIADNPHGPPVIRGTGGVRKIRIKLTGHGKSSGARVLYVDFTVREVIGLVFAYPKSETESITEGEKKLNRQLVDTLNENGR